MALATVVLAYATIVLAKYTKAIDSREKKNKREDDLRKCIILAQIIIKPAEKVSSGGMVAPTPTFIQPYSELVALGDYFHDSDTRRTLESIYTSLVSLVMDPLTPSDSSALYSGNEILQKRLVNEIIRWQKDLGNFK